MTIRDGQFVMLVHNIQKTFSCNRRSFFSFHPHTLFTVETSLILSESHTSAAVYMNYGKRVHNSPVSHAFTRPSNCRRPRRLRALPPFTLILRLKIIRTGGYTVVSYTGRDLINHVTCNYRRVLSRGVLISR